MLDKKGIHWWCTSPNFIHSSIVSLLWRNAPTEIKPASWLFKEYLHSYKLWTLSWPFPFVRKARRYGTDYCLQQKFLSVLDYFVSLTYPIFPFRNQKMKFNRSRINPQGSRKTFIAIDLWRGRQPTAVQFSTIQGWPLSDRKAIGGKKYDFEWWWPDRAAD